MKKPIVFLVLFTTFFSENCVAQFDRKSLNKFTVYLFLTSQDSAERERALRYIADSTSSIEPHTLMMAGMTLYKKGYKDSSLYWIYLGDIREKYLSSLYKHRSNAALYSSLHAIAIQLTQDYAKNNVQMLYKKINQALEFDSLNPLKPLAFLEIPNDTSQYIPFEQWKAHYDIVRQYYYNLDQEIFQNGNAIFQEDIKKKMKSK